MDGFEPQCSGELQQALHAMTRRSLTGLKLTASWPTHKAAWGRRKPPGAAATRKSRFAMITHQVCWWACQPCSVTLRRLAQSMWRLSLRWPHGSACFLFSVQRMDDGWWVAVFDQTNQPEPVSQVSMATPSDGSKAEKWTAGMSYTTLLTASDIQNKKIEEIVHAVLFTCCCSV